MKKTVALLLFTVLFFGTLIFQSVCYAESCEVDERHNYLICGVDDAYMNTDVCIILSINSRDGNADFIQIPRDTAINYLGKTRRINSVLPILINKGLQLNDAARGLSDLISCAFGITFDGFLVITPDMLRGVVDALGGLNVVLPQKVDLSMFDGSGLDLIHGSNRLNGDDTVRLIRHRQGYALGDLTRIKVQRIVLASLLRTVLEKLDGALVIKLFRVIPKDNISFIFNKTLNFFIKNSGRLQDYTLNFASVAGKAAQDGQNRWLYFLSKKANDDMLARLGILTNGGFDPNRLFLIDEGNFKQLYFSDSIGFRIQSYDELSQDSLS